MNNKYDLILWDLDGTILDTKQSLIDAIHRTLIENNLGNLTNEQLEQFIGPPFEDVVMPLFNISYEEANKLAVVFRDNYFKYEMYNTYLYDGIKNIIIEIKNRNIKQGLATYKSENCVFPLMEHFNLNNLFDTMHGSIIDKKLTKTDIMKLAMMDAQIADTNRILMIGDTIHDLNGAKELDCDFVYANYGFGNISELKEQKYNKFLGCVDTANELLNFI